MVIIFLLLGVVALSCVVFYLSFQERSLERIVHKGISALYEHNGSSVPAWLNEQTTLQRFNDLLNKNCLKAGVNQEYKLFILKDEYERSEFMRFIAKIENSGHSLKKQASAATEYISLMWDSETSRDGLFFSRAR